MIEILVASPANYATGGVELLHQLCSELNSYEDISAKMLYWHHKEVPGKSPQPKEYEEYHCDYVTHHNMGIPSGFKGVLIVPEIWANRVADPDVRKCIKVVYWESVDNYFKHTPAKDWFRFKNADAIHICQSYYAWSFIYDCGITPMMVTDYINEDFLKIPENHIEKENIIIYNPAKDTEYIRLIMNTMPDVDFIPITGMSREEVIETMWRAKVYIDFGDHPGKERMPREAVSCRCVPIVAEIGGAYDYSDVPLNMPENKLSRDYGSLIAIKKIVEKVFRDFDSESEKMDHYREKIRAEKERFKRHVKDFVFKLREVTE